MKRHPKVRGGAAAIDDRGSAYRGRTRRARHVQGLPRRSARGHDVLDDKNAVRRLEREAAAQVEAPVLTLGEDGAHAEGTPDFVADHDAPKRRGEHNGDAERTDEGGDGRAER